MAAVVTGGSGLHGHRVDWLRGRLTVVDVMTRQGLRQWPKSKKSHRTVPVPPPAMEGMSVLMAGRPRNTLVFTAFEGGAVTDEHFRDRIWYPAVEAAGIRRFPRGSCGTQPRAGWCRTGFAVRGSGAPRPRGLCHDAAVRAPCAGCSRQGDPVVGAAYWRTSGARDSESRSPKMGNRPLTWVGVAGLNRRPLRPEAKLRHELPAPQRAWPAADRPWVSADVRRWPWRLSLTSSLGRCACADGRWPDGSRDGSDGGPG